MTDKDISTIVNNLGDALMELADMVAYLRDRAEQAEHTEQRLEARIVLIEQILAQNLKD